MIPASERIYWLGFQLALSQALGLKDGGGNLLATMARVAPEPVPATAFRTLNGQPMKLDSVATTVSRCRSSLADLGLKISIVRKDFSFWISKADAEKLRLIAESGAA